MGMMIPNATSFEVAHRRHPSVKRRPAFLDSVFDPLLSTTRAIKKRRVCTRRIMFDDDEEDDDSLSLTPFIPDSLPLLQQQQQQHRRRYELIDDADKFELRLDVPGVKQDDIDIKIDDDKNLI